MDMVTPAAAASVAAMMSAASIRRGHLCGGRRGGQPGDDRYDSQGDECRGAVHPRR